MGYSESRAFDDTVARYRLLGQDVKYYLHPGEDKKDPPLRDGDIVAWRHLPKANQMVVVLHAWQRSPADQRKGKKYGIRYFMVKIYDPKSNDIYNVPSWDLKHKDDPVVRCEIDNEPVKPGIVVITQYQYHPLVGKHTLQHSQKDAKTYFDAKNWHNQEWVVLDAEIQEIHSELKGDWPKQDYDCHYIWWLFIQPVHLYKQERGIEPGKRKAKGAVSVD